LFRCTITLGGNKNANTVKGAAKTQIGAGWIDISPYAVFSNEIRNLSQY